MTGYTASSTLVEGTKTYSPNGILLAIPWCADMAVDTNPWIDVIINSYFLINSIQLTIWLFIQGKFW